VARLDRFIQILHEQRADALRLGAGTVAALVAKGGNRPLTKEALSDAQIVALVREIAPAPLAGDITPQAQLSFPYASPSGAVDVELAAGAEGLVATVRPAAGNGAAALDGARSAGAAAGGIVTESPAAAERRARARADVEELLRILVESGASDLHLRAGEPAVFRRHGELARHDGPAYTPDRLGDMIDSIMEPREAAEYRESGDADWAYEIAGLARFRCNAGRDRHGPLLVTRVIASKVPTTDELGLSREVQALCHLSKGLVVVTGPTGSGKSTTLAAMVDLVNRTRSDHILTIEDPIEFVHQGKKCVVTQREVGRHTRGFKQALRAALREDPDVILVGEMRDLETVSIAIETAETGHLVFGTLHTTTAAGTIDRIIDQFPADRQAQIRVMLAESLKGVVAQTLVRKIGGGRVAAREILLSIPAITNLIREGKTFQIPSIMQTNRKGGMVTLNDALMELVDQKQVEPREAYVKAVEKSGFVASLKAKRHDTSWLGESA
jgi:twitching motility protein PilT